MLMALAMVLLFISGALCVASLVVLAFLFKRKSLLHIWSDSPPMALLFLSTCLTSIIYLVFSIQWILVSMEVVENVPGNGVFLLLPGLGLVTSRTLYDSAHMGVYAQRIAVLKFPMRSTIMVNNIIVSGVIIVTIPPVLALIYFHISTMPPTGNPIPTGCYAFNCLVSTARSRRLCTVTVKLVFTGTVVVLGALFLFMLRKFKIRRSTAERRINQFAGYSFCLRLVFEMAPFIADFVLQETIRKDLGKFIGPYGAIGGSIDFFACTLLYYVLSFMRRSSVTIVKSTNTHV
uniref:7TM_GPCR_Srx domain-containing protein n=1 Tax=Steinernema glaseri TaxID=37863 RepID=A0A1I7XX66_9BILA